MNIKELFKKYWFVLLVGIVLIVFVVAWAIDSKSNKVVESKVQTKQVDGKDVLFEMDGNPYTADEFYDVMDKSATVQIALDDLTAIIANKEIKTTEEIKTLATANAQNMIINYTSEQLDELMRANGLKKYGNITTFYEEMIRKQELEKKFLLDHDEDLIVPYIENNQDSKLKKVSHILIKVADITQDTATDGNSSLTPNPTEEELNKLNAVLDALKEKSFAEVAKEYSEDGSAADGGYLGTSTDEEMKQTYVKEFADAAAELEYGKQSGVIVSQYGYHIILVEEPTHEEMLDNATFFNGVMNDNNAEAYIKMLVEYSKKYNIEIVSQEIKDIFDTVNPEETTDGETNETEVAE